jgi:hypothetical protein
MRRHPPHHLGPARAKHPAGQDPEAGLSHHSNAPIKPQSQSILSKKVAQHLGTNGHHVCCKADVQYACSRDPSADFRGSVSRHGGLIRTLAIFTMSTACDANKC